MTKNHLLALADIYGNHFGITHWTVSMRIFNKGDFFQNLKNGADCRTATFNKVLQWFSDHWPADLAWPEDIPRPAPSSKERAHA